MKYFAFFLLTFGIQLCAMENEPSRNWEKIKKTLLKKEIKKFIASMQDKREQHIKNVNDDDSGIPGNEGEELPSTPNLKRKRPCGNDKTIVKKRKQ